MYPVRTCVACRQRVSRTDLLRVVLRGDQLIADDRAVLTGRGAWVHLTFRCLNQALVRGVFSRALKVSGRLDTAFLENRLKSLMDN